MNKKFIIVVSLCVLFLFSLYYFTPKENEVNVNEEIKEQEVVETIKPNNTIYVEIKGNVKNPGVYTMTTEDRVFHLITKAGGLLPNADLSNINQTKKLVDEMVITINVIDQTPKDSNIPISIKPFPNDEEKGDVVNLNTADLDELQTIPGIGPSKALSIIDYRNKNGGFSRIEDLMNVSGIGQSTFDKIKIYIKV